MNIQCIYQLKCKDNNIKETYIGSTVNYRKRMNDHKCSSLNLRDGHYCLPLYMFINVNGGIDNWYGEILETCVGMMKTTRRYREQFYINMLKPKLNCYYATGIDINKKQKTKHKWNKVKMECDICGSILLKNNIGRHMINLHGSSRAIKPISPMIVSF